MERFNPPARIVIDGVKVESVNKDRDIYKKITIFIFKFENGLKIPFEFSDTLFDINESKQSIQRYVMDSLTNAFRKEMMDVANDALENGYIPTYMRDEKVTYAVEFNLEDEYFKDASRDLKIDVDREIVKDIYNLGNVSSFDDISVEELFNEEPKLNENCIVRFQDILEED